MPSTIIFGMASSKTLHPRFPGLWHPIIEITGTRCGYRDSFLMTTVAYRDGLRIRRQLQRLAEFARSGDGSRRSRFMHPGNSIPSNGRKRPPSATGLSTKTSAVSSGRLKSRACGESCRRQSSRCLRSASMRLSVMKPLTTAFGMSALVLALADLIHSPTAHPYLP